MTGDLEKAAEELKKFGLDLTTVLRDTHAETAMRLVAPVIENDGNF